jgi:enediyne biosynthesis protein E7
VSAPHTIDLRPRSRLFELLRDDPLAFFVEAAAMDPEIVLARLGKQSIYLLNHPKLVKLLLVDEAASFAKAGQLRLLGDLLGNGLLTSDGELHLRQRRLLQPLFVASALGAYGPIVADVASSITARWTSGETRDVETDMTALTLEVIGRSMFGASFERLAPEFRTLFDTLMRIYHPRAYASEDGARAGDSSEEKLAQMRGFLDGLIDEIVAARRAAGSGSDDLLDRMLALSPDALRDEMVTFIFAGHETTSSALTWTLALLARHPGVADETPPRVRQALREAVRLYPPVWNISRRAIAPVKLGEHTIEPGSLVFASPFLLQRDARFWERPLAFDPSRWDAPETSRSPAYLPFGLGVRRCIGEGFAWMEAEIALATILHDFEVHLVGPDVPAPLALTTLKPKGGLSLRVERR